MDSTKVIIDTKKDLVELANNLCRTIEHERIRKEIQKASEIGCERFVFLIADPHISCIEEVNMWECPKRANGTKYTYVSPLTLQKIMFTMKEKYNIDFLFCRKKEMGQVIIELLGGI